MNPRPIHKMLEQLLEELVEVRKENKNIKSKLKAILDKYGIVEEDAA